MLSIEMIISYLMLGSQSQLTTYHYVQIRENSSKAFRITTYPFLFQVASVNMFSPPVEVVASRDHIMHVVYSFLQPSAVLEWFVKFVHSSYNNEIGVQIFLRIRRETTLQCMNYTLYDSMWLNLVKP